MLRRLQQVMEAEAILTEDAIHLLATKLRTPLQVQLHLSLALETGYLSRKIALIRAQRFD